jgi:hypothetical protein
MISIQHNALAINRNMMMYLIFTGLTIYYNMKLEFNFAIDFMNSTPASNKLLKPGLHLYAGVGPPVHGFGG